MEDKTPHHKPLSILVVDGNSTDLLLIKEALEEVQPEGLELTCVQRLAEALAILHKKYFDAVLLNLNLPDSQGLETFVRLQHKHSTIPILILSDCNDEPIALQSMQGGAQDFVIKDTINGALLARSIRYAIERNRSAQRLIDYERNYRRLFEAAQDGIIILDADTGIITDANPHLEKLLGYTNTEFLGKRLWEINAFHDKAAREAVRRLLQEKNYSRYEKLPLQTKNGQVIAVELITIAYSSNDQQFLQCNIRDITERESAEQERTLVTLKLQDQRQHLNDILANMPAIIWEAEVGSDGSQKPTYVSKYSETMLGYSPQEWYSTPNFWLNITHPDDKEHSIQRTIDEFTSGEGFVNESRLIAKDGRLVWIESHTEFIRDPQNTIIGLRGVSIDITERKQTERELQESNERFQLLVNNINDTFWIRSTDMSKQLYLSPSFEKMWGVSVEAQYANPNIWGDFIVPEDRQRVIDEFSALKRDTPSVNIEYRITRADGEVRWLQTRGFQVRNEVGELIRLTGIVSDITERKQAETSLQQSEQQFRAVFSNSLDAIIITDNDGRFLECNDAACLLYGTDREQLLEMKFTDFLGSDWNFSQFNLNFRKTGREKGEHQITLPDGTRKHVEYAAIADFLPGRHLTTFHDITERKEAETGLAYLASIIESSNDAIFSKTMESVITSWNTGAEELFGYSKKEAVGSTVYMLVDSEHTEEEALLLKKILRGERIANFETVRVRKDGKRLDVSLTLSPIKNKKGETIGVSAISRDISERKRIQNALRASKEQFQSIVVNVPGIAYQYILHPNGSLEMPFISKQCLEVLDIDPKIIQNNPGLFKHMIHPEDRGEFERSAVISAERLLPWDWKGRVQLPSGQIKWLHGASRPQRLPNGGTLWNGLLMDITDHKEAEIERDRFFILTLDLMGIANNSGYFKRLNPAFKTTLGFSNEELMEVPFLEFVHPDDRAATLKIMDKLASGESIIQFENRYRCRDGFYKWLQWMATPFEDLWYFAARDITDLKIAEATLHKTNDELELRVLERTAELQEVNNELQSAREIADEANLAKSEFLSRMSHELRTPLNAILGFGQILYRKELDPLAKESVGHILKGGRHLLTLINEVLDIARVEAGRMELSLEPVALADVVPEICNLVQPIADERDIQLKVNMPQLLGTYVQADHQRLNQVLINLLSNAIKYNLEGGQVEVSCKQNSLDRISITVRDTGPGIDSEKLSKLFTPFERLDADNSGIEGTGLGLVLSQRLVSAMNGTLNVESVVGSGTTLTVELSQANAPEVVMVAKPGNSRLRLAATAVENTYCVLCIEDNRSNLRLLETLFEDRPDIELISAIQGSIGLELALRHEPDLILLDLNLPDMHGNRVLEHLQNSAITRDIPVVVISADATPKQIERLMEAGAKEYLTKPIDVEEFLHLLDKFLQPSSDGEISIEKGAS